tara:strand:+ start:2926 stop:3267 length:342 start_codon:yes stop_codon:yes gene_type:complete
LLTKIQKLLSNKPTTKASPHVSVLLGRLSSFVENNNNTKKHHHHHHHSFVLLQSKRRRRNGRRRLTVSPNADASKSSFLWWGESFSLSSLKKSPFLPHKKTPPKSLSHKKKSI